MTAYELFRRVLSGRRPVDAKAQMVEAVVNDLTVLTPAIELPTGAKVVFHVLGQITVWQGDRLIGTYEPVPKEKQ